jgi:hypothetical protein
MTLEPFESLIASGFSPKRHDVQVINGCLVTPMAESPWRAAICDAIRLAIEAFLLATRHIRSEKECESPRGPACRVQTSSCAAARGTT